MDERTLTDADVAAIASAISKQTACSLGITGDDALELCEFASWLRKLRHAIGNVIIYGFILFLGLLFYLGVGKWK